jgi:hypothetical protein
MSGPKKDWLLLTAVALLDELEQGERGHRAIVAIEEGLGPSPGRISTHHAAKLAVNLALKLREIESARRQYDDGTNEKPWLEILRMRESEAAA